MSKHTPGPWKIDRGHQTKTPRGISAITRNIVNFNGLSAPMDPDTEANARLIAAAPELLEVLKDLCSFETELTQEKWDRARDVIAKAEGKDND